LEERSVLRRPRTTSASSLSVSGKELVPSSRWWSVRFLRRSVRGEYQIGGPTQCASAPSHRYHAMPPRRTRNSDRPRASDSHHGRTDSSSVGRAMENKKTDFHFAVRGLRCELQKRTAQSRKRKESRSDE
jgi:hypothetical protein